MAQCDALTTVAPVPVRDKARAVGVFVGACRAGDQGRVALVKKKGKKGKRRKGRIQLRHRQCPFLWLENSVRPPCPHEKILAIILPIYWRTPGWFLESFPILVLFSPIFRQYFSNKSWTLTHFCTHNLLPSVIFTTNCLHDPHLDNFLLNDAGFTLSLFVCFSRYV